MSEVNEMMKRYEFSEMRKKLNEAHLEIIKRRQYRGARETDVVAWLADYVEQNFVPKAQLERAEEALNKAISSAEFFSRHADCRKDSWACKCEFCKNTTATKELREAREYFKEKEQV